MQMLKTVSTSGGGSVVTAWRCDTHCETNQRRLTHEDISIAAESFVYGPQV